MSSPAELVKLLKEASDAYYNGGELKMDDDTYDALLERLRAADPTNPYLQAVGAPPGGSTIQLPFPMPSLDKIKPGQDALTRFLAAGTPHGFLLSEKLDGLSALWVADKRALYLRGDGLVGQDISHLVPLGIQGLVRTPGAVIRGELVVPRSTVTTLARSWVNGIVHRKTPDPVEVAKIHFVAYDVMAPLQRNRSVAQMWLQSKGFETAWVQASAQPTQESLIQALKDRREQGNYDTDGIVVAWNTCPSRVAGAANPKDMVAFKMPLSEQTATTTVVAVHWGTSAQGYLIPRLEIQPVTINGATIQFCTAHNAKTVQDARLGPGAQVAIRRSGDVIPTIDRVIAGAAAASFPAAETWEWASDVHIRSKGESADLARARLHHFLKTLEIPGSGPATAAALVEGSITGPKSLLAASEARLKELLGPKTGASLFANIRTALASATEQRLMIASSMMPRGVGETKLTVLFAKDPNSKRWQTAFGCDAPTGWTHSSFQAFLTELPKYLEWRERELPAVTAAAVAAAPKPPTANAQVICMTGFRDKALEEKAVAAGHTVSTTLTSKVTILLVPDGELKDSEKVKAARAKGTRILSRSDFASQYLSS